MLKSRVRIRLTRIRVHIGPAAIDRTSSHGVTARAPAVVAVNDGHLAHIASCHGLPLCNATTPSA